MRAEAPTSYFAKLHDKSQPDADEPAVAKKWHERLSHVPTLAHIAAIARDEHALDGIRAVGYGNPVPEKLARGELMDVRALSRTRRRASRAVPARVT